ncbi:MAG: hypothetical protein PHU21_00670, partial [Elusimicrobia bacterium]|nr:hypothetical protein [Elusimicrobiota bacterium]
SGHGFFKIEAAVIGSGDHDPAFSIRVAAPAAALDAHEAVVEFVGAVVHDGDALDEDLTLLVGVHPAEVFVPERGEAALEGEAPEEGFFNEEAGASLFEASGLFFEAVRAEVGAWGRGWGWDRRCGCDEGSERQDRDAG